MAVTAKDVARDLNLSQPTVSRILSGDRHHRTSDATRRRVFEAAQRMGYQRNAVASSLRRGKTGVIGLHTSHNYDARNDFYGTIMGALQVACRARHLDLLLHSARHGSPAEEMFGKLRDGRIDGLILHARLGDPLVGLLSQASLPVVAIADSLSGIPSVSCDGESGMGQLLELLWNRGHRDYVFLAPTIALPSVEQRRAKFESELAARGVEASRRRIIEIEFERAAPALDDLLEGDRKPVVCCWNDSTAYNLLRACREKGVSVPQRLAVAGFDGFPDDKVPSHRLVTVACPWEEAAARALELLIGLIDPVNSDDLPVSDVCLPVSLIDGDTA